MAALGIDIADGGLETQAPRSRLLGFEIEPITTTFVSFLLAFFGGMAELL